MLGHLVDADQFHGIDRAPARLIRVVDARSPCCPAPSALWVGPDRFFWMRPPGRAYSYVTALLAVRRPVCLPDDAHGGLSLAEQPPLERSIPSSTRPPSAGITNAMTGTAAGSGPSPFQSTGMLFSGCWGRKRIATADPSDSVLHTFRGARVEWR